MASAGLPERSGTDGTPAGRKAGGNAELQARVDWLLSEEDPWSDLEEEPPCFCTARLAHRDFAAIRTHLAHRHPEMRTVHEEDGPAYVELEWPEESLVWPDWLDRPDGYRGAGEVRVGERFVEIWTPTRSRMRRLLASLLQITQAGVEVRELTVEDPLEELAGRLEMAGSDDLNPDLDSGALDPLVGFDLSDADHDAEGPDLDLRDLGLDPGAFPPA
ncbi:hypothetical protein [Limnochorda pilosa]|uniref:Uncharacterized protein n=1 Tax=Limnochorda pilosa TaxID=1555112 RepID=A0A0K2SKU5_LIMPI|nr:hypothetical protein [Limnochorda pilosa]BAS27728.1 hypothetical protein LIP_1886 [Limnochorda pilosa]